MKKIIYSVLFSLLILFRFSYSKNNIEEILDKLDFDLSEDTYFNPKLKENKIDTYVVLPAEIDAEWLHQKEKENKRKRFEKRNAEKIELMLLRLEKKCVERSKLLKIMEENDLSYQTLITYASITTYKYS